MVTMVTMVTEVLVANVAVRQIMGDWDSGETVFLQHAVSDLSTYILTLKTYRYLYILLHTSTYF